ncbi:MAG: EamA family transporter [Acidimicrobiia bacterium]|nr:EamA family transporter [Acidimicrobiia bacterium]MDH3470549.1 EamA family transporter [Acidimicrobiia bacterium]
MPVFLASMSAVLSGTGDFLGGLASRHGRVTAVVVSSHLVGIATTFVLAPFVGGSPTGADLAWGAAAGASGGLAILALYNGFSRAAVAIVSPIAAIGAGAWPVVFDLVDGGRPSALQGVGLAVGFVAIWLVGSGEAQSGPSWKSAGVVFGMLAGLGFGGLLILLSRVSEDSGIWALAPARAAGAVVLIAVGLAAGHELLPHRRSLLPLAGAGAATIAGNGAFIVATHDGSLAVVSVVAAMFPAATVVLARVFFRERLSRSRLIGLGLALVAVALVAAG